MRLTATLSRRHAFVALLSGVLRPTPSPALEAALGAEADPNLRARSMMAYAPLVGSDFFAVYGVVPPRVFSPAAVATQPRWNAWGSCVENSCTYVPLKQRCAPVIRTAAHSCPRTSSPTAAGHRRRRVLQVRRARGVRPARVSKARAADRCSGLGLRGACGGAFEQRREATGPGGGRASQGRAAGQPAARLAQQPARGAGGLARALLRQRTPPVEARPAPTPPDRRGLWSAAQPGV